MKHLHPPHLVHTDRRRRSRGFLSMELALTLPILGMVLFALFEFSLLFSARGTLVEASRVGARAASLAGATPEQVQETMLRTLSPKMRANLQFRADLGTHSGDTVTVGAQVPMSAVAPNLLWPIGFDLQGRYLYAEAAMIKE